LLDNKNNLANLTHYFAKKVKIKGKIYLSLRNAAKNLKESRTNIFRKCLDVKNQDYELIETSFVAEKTNVKAKQATQTDYFKASLPCEINNLSYASLNKASKKLGIHSKTIKKRILSPSYPNYSFKN
jgi:uncharacterized membrane protein